MSNIERLFEDFEGEYQPIDVDWENNVEDPELSPGKPETCAGNGEHPGIECCCDECDHFLQCFPECDPAGVDKEDFSDFLGPRMHWYGLALVHTYPAIVTDDYPELIEEFIKLMQEHQGECTEEDIAWARNLLRKNRALHDLETDFPE